MKSKMLAAFAAMSVLAASTAASAQSAAPLSLSGSPALERAGAPAESGNELRGGYGWIMAIVALGILIFVISELGDDPTLPASA
jgi:hypothetical protein